MRSGFRKIIFVVQLALLLVSLAVISGCWILLPEETAIVVEVLGAKGGPVDGVSLLLDGSDTLITGSAGQVFKSLSQEGDHTIQLDTATLIDPQGGIGWVPLASQVSGELAPRSFADRPFAGGSDVLVVPVNKGEITVVTVYLDDIQKSPLDNQWLTDGLDAANSYRTANTDEFGSNLRPTFWWRQDPSLGTTITYTFQLWEDDDADTRFPLGVVDHPQYKTAMDPSGPGYLQPDWQVPLAGIQRAEITSTVNQVVVWSSQASDASTPIDYDLYYAPTSQWSKADWEKNPVLRDVQGIFDGAAIKIPVGAGTGNTGVVLKNGVEYTFALRARDGASNLDTTGSTSTRRATPPGSSSSLGSVSIISAVADSTVGGQIDIDLTCQPTDNLRVYTAPSSDFNARPFDERFIRDTHLCPDSGTDSYVLDRLVNGKTYAVGFEPFDANGNVGTASSVALATPSYTAALDTTAPTGLTLTVTPMGNGDVDVMVSAVADSSSVVRRIYWAPASFTSNEEAMMFTTYPSASPQETLSLTDIPDGIPYNYVARAIDSFGNSAIAASQVTLTGGDGIGPTWASDDPAFFSTVSYSMGSTTWPLGATWSYGSAAGGFALGQDPVQGQGEYVWRVIQENPDRGITRATKLGAFYSWSGYYYASTESERFNMSSSGPSSNADHRDVFSFVEGASNVLSADVMGTPFDSSDSAGYRQRTASQFSSSLAAGSWTTNQLTILYNTNAYGQAVVREISSPARGFAGILRVFSVNKQRPWPTRGPHLQAKEFQLSYYDFSDELVNSPEPTFGGSGIFFFGTLDEPDYQDPLW
ncbi:MAG: hypothetical protein RRA15_01075 [bacterium]|nr:hypothetical protein [bacterium]